MSCCLNGRKALVRLFFRPKTVRFAALACFSGQKPSVLPHFSLESEPTGKLPFPVRSPPVFYPLRRYENKRDFHQLISTKSKMQSRIFLQLKEKTSVLFLDFYKSGLARLAQLSLFSPLFWLYFIRRIYRYGDKVKCLCVWWMCIVW